jgi:hypothetical protein
MYVVTGSNLAEYMIKYGTSFWAAMFVTHVSPASLLDGSGF